MRIMKHDPYFKDCLSRCRKAGVYTNRSGTNPGLWSERGTKEVPMELREKNTESQ